MAFEHTMQTIGLNAGADLSAAQHLIVKLNSSGDVILGAAAGDAVIGVLQNAPASSDPAQIAVGGIAKVQAGGAITAGNRLTTNASGQAVAAAPATGVNNGVIGYAVNGGASGEIISVLVQPHTIQGA